MEVCPVLLTEQKRADKINSSKAVYELLVSEKTLEGISYICYGISLHFAGAVVNVEDLSLNRDEVELLVERCNRLELSPLHFQAVIEDFMER